MWRMRIGQDRVAAICQPGRVGDYHMRLIPPTLTLVVLFLYGVACAPATAPRTTEAPSGGSSAPVASGQPSRTLVVAIRTEPASAGSAIAR